MAFRRRSRRFVRRRRRGPETYTKTSCRECVNVYGNMPCGAPLIDIFEVLTMRTPRNSADATEISNPSSKAVIFDGMKFQSLWLHDPNDTVDCSAPNPAVNPNASAMAMIVTIWEALMLLPLAQGSFVPAYLPQLTQGVFQQGDTADRVLWKRLSHLFVQGVRSNPNVSFFQNPDTTARYNTENPVAVKTRCRIDDRHGLFYVRNFVHNVFLTFPPNPCTAEIDCDNCSPDNEQAICGRIPIFNDFWSKIFYHVRG